MRVGGGKSEQLEIMDLEREMLLVLPTGDVHIDEAKPLPLGILRA